jgi:group I intron endonuclease
MKNKNYCVYCHINKVNGKKYIGITGSSLEERANNGRGYLKCPLFAKAIKKYGWDNFDHIVLYDNLTADEANKLEVEMIAYYGTTNPLVGYNLSVGGGGSNGITPSEETKTKISKANKGRVKDDVWRKHLSESRMGYMPSEEHRKNLSLSHMGKSGSQHPRSKPVYQISLDTGEILNRYDSANLAAQAVNRDSGGIVATCKGNRKSCGGFKWQYA